MRGAVCVYVRVCVCAVPARCCLIDQCAKCVCAVLLFSLVANANLSFLEQRVTPLFQFAKGSMTIATPPPDCDNKQGTEQPHRLTHIGPHCVYTTRRLPVMDASALLDDVMFF